MLTTRMMPGTAAMHGSSARDYLASSQVDCCLYWMYREHQVQGAPCTWEHCRLVEWATQVG